jgi:hypothetical protein
MVVRGNLGTWKYGSEPSEYKLNTVENHAINQNWIVIEVERV